MHKPDRRPFPTWLPPLVSQVDYGCVVPLLARLPRPAGQALANVRGRINWLFDFDWRTLSLGHRYVKSATLEGMQAVLAAQGVPPPDMRRARRLARQRYECTSREEVDSWRLTGMDFARLRCEIVGLEHLRAARAKGQGVVLAKAHFDALYIALAALAHSGESVVNLMGTRTIFDPRIPRAIRRHYEQKTDALMQVLAPGRLAFFEDGMGFFVKALRRGEVVAMACDGPSSTPERASPVHFLGRRRRMSSGLEFLARATNSPVAFMACHELPGQRFRIMISPPVLHQDGGVQRAYDELQRLLVSRPQSWWAADQYSGYIDAP